MTLIITWVRFLEGHKPSPSFCICSRWQMPILWCAKLEPVLKPPLLTSVTDVSCSVVFSEGEGGGWSCEDCAGGGPGPTLATLTRQRLLRVSHSTLCTAALALTALQLLCTQPLSPEISVCRHWNKVHKVLELIMAGFLLLFYLRREGNYASCIRSKEFELFYYLVLMKAEQMGWHVWKYQVCEGWNSRASTLWQFHPAQRCLWEGYKWQAGHFSGTAHFCTDVKQCVS